MNGSKHLSPASPAGAATAVKTVAVIGAGTMGNGIAQVFAQTGHEVKLIDTQAGSLERAVKSIGSSLDRLIKKELMSAADKDATLKRLQTGADLKSASGADWVVEAVFEDLAVKKKIFEELDRVTPKHAVLASNTSSISITEIAAATKRPEQVIGMHFMNPVPVMKLVEVIRGLQTSDATYEETAALAQSLGKTP